MSETTTVLVRFFFGLRGMPLLDKATCLSYKGSETGLELGRTRPANRVLIFTMAIPIGIVADRALEIMAVIVVALGP